MEETKNKATYKMKQNKSQERVGQKETEKKEKDERTYMDLIPQRDSVIVKGEYWDFVKWLSQPRKTRMPKTQEELGKELGIAETTLSRWKNVEGFKDDVLNIVRKGAVDRVGNVLAALEKGIDKRGQGADVEKWFKWALGEEDADTQKVKGIFLHITPDVKQLRDEYEKKLKELKTK